VYINAVRTVTIFEKDKLDQKTARHAPVVENPKIARVSAWLR
jgi:hypothetical protein